MIQQPMERLSETLIKSVFYGNLAAQTSTVLILMLLKPSCNEEKVAKL